MTDEELRQLVESNARTAQAMLDAMAEARMEREESREQFYQGMQRVEDVIQRLTTVQEEMINLLASLNDDRPTILRRLSSIENKVDRLLDTE